MGKPDEPVFTHNRNYADRFPHTIISMPSGGVEPLALVCRDQDMAICSLVYSSTEQFWNYHYHNYNGLRRQSRRKNRKKCVVTGNNCWIVTTDNAEHFSLTWAGDVINWLAVPSVAQSPLESTFQEIQGWLNRTSESVIRPASIILLDPFYGIVVFKQQFIFLTYSMV